MSSMKLRSKIRAPVRYGEDEEERSRRTSLRKSTDDTPDDTSELEVLGKPRSQKRRRTNTVPFNPNLPPAAFPTLDRPEQKHDSTSITSSQRPANSHVSSPPSSTEAPMNDVPLNELENHFASNNMDNPVYARNMNNMAQTTRADIEDTAAMETSDSDEWTTPPDAEQVLLDKIPNPEWNDLHPAMQVEIIENAMKHHDWRRICNMFGLGADERMDFMQVLDTRNKQIERENKRLETMRRKQRNALMGLDNSELRRFAPPPQLILKRITRQATRGLIVTKYTDLLMCEAHEFLKARQFLHQHGLPREYAGNWGDSLVVLQDSVADSSGPDKFEWSEHIRFSPPPKEIKNPLILPHDPIIDAKSRFIESAGLAGTVNPKDLVRPPDSPEPILDWDKYFPRIRDGLWDTQEPRPGGRVKLNIGPEKAAQIQAHEDPDEDRGHGHVTPDRREVYKKQAMQGFPSASSPPETPVETPSKPSRSTRIAGTFPNWPARPISRVLPSHSESQAKYVRDIQRVQLERLEAEAQALRRRQPPRSSRQVENGVGVEKEVVSAVVHAPLGALTIEN
ncbi:hypothetical protein N7461_000394 [Penicillium sp. DV-2018c]|nr:hypothetical protein N7461_000394 [Penicillium sp. DV-2018c]